MSCLLIFFELIKEKTSEGVHRFNMSVMCSRLVISDCELKILLNHIVIGKLIVLANLELGLFESILYFWVAIVHGLLEAVESLLTVGLSVNASWMLALFTEHSNLVNSVWLKLIRRIAIIVESFFQISFSANAILI